MDPLKPAAQEQVDEGLEEPAVLEEIEVEDLAVDGICGVY
jgi:mycofactocin precursor